MKTYVMLFSGLLVATLVCVAVIHYEGQQTREAMKAMSHEDISKGVRQGIDDSIQKATKDALDVDHVIGKVKSTIGQVLDTDDDTSDDKPSRLKIPKPADVMGRVRDTVGTFSGDTLGGKDDPLNPGAVLDRVRDTLGGSSGSKSPKKGEDDEPSSTATDEKQKDDKPKGAAGLLNAAFDIADQLTKTGDDMGQEMFKLSEAQERDWGKRLNEQITKDAEVVNDPKYKARLARVTEPLLKARKRQGIAYTFTVLESDDDDINAFSIAGGYIYVHEALMKFAKLDHELQFVLGHEIGHVDLGHCARQLTYTARASELATPIAGNVVGVLHGLLTRPYQQKHEYEADEYAFRALIAAGRTREQALDFTRHFDQWLKKEGHTSATYDTEKPSPDSVQGVLTTRVMDHFHTHPPMDERLRRLEAIEVNDTSSKSKK